MLTSCLGAWCIQHFPNDRYHPNHGLTATVTKDEIKSDPEVEISNFFLNFESAKFRGFKGYPSQRDHLQRHPSNVIMTFGLVF